MVKLSADVPQRKVRVKTTNLYDIATGNILAELQTGAIVGRLLGLSRRLETSTGAPDAAMNGRMYGAPPATMIAPSAGHGTCRLISRKMKATNNSQPFGAVFLFSRQRGCPAEVIMSAQCLHNDNGAQNADDLQ